MRTGTGDRGPESRAHVGASDLQALPLSEGIRELCATYIKQWRIRQGNDGGGVLKDTYCSEPPRGEQGGGKGAIGLDKKVTL